MANPFFSGRIPPDLLDRVEKHCAETGETKTDILISALAAYLNYPVSRPAPTINSEERFKALEDRVTVLEALLEKTSDQYTVINTDNSDLSLNVTNGLPTENEFSNFDNNDNKFDNITLIPDEVLKDPWQNDIEQKPDNKFDNKLQIHETSLKFLPECLPEKFEDSTASEQISKKFENLNASELVNLTGLRRPQIDGYKSLLIKRLEKVGKPFIEKTLLESPERIETPKPVTINGYPYDLFYLGQNEKGKNLWSVQPYDNKRYQQLSIEPSFKEILDSSK